ncbi:F-box domain-containing protein [Pleurotus pulmonarius]
MSTSNDKSRPVMGRFKIDANHRIASGVAATIRQMKRLMGPPINHPVNRPEPHTLNGTIIVDQTGQYFPTELIKKIIALLDDRPVDEEVYYCGEPRRVPTGLVACSLVCSSWNDICRPHIFRSVTLDYSRELDIPRFSFLYFTAPHICTYIRNLELRLPENPGAMSRWVQGRLPRFTNLHELRLDGNFPVWCYPNRATLSMYVSHVVSLLPDASTSHVKRLDLRCWSAAAENLLPLLSACRDTLEDLSVEIDFRPESSLDSETSKSMSEIPSFVHLNALRSLKIHERYATRLPLTNFIECPNLEALKIEHYTEELWDIPPWIPAGLSNLNFNVDPNTALPDLGTTIHPSHLTINIQKQEDAPYLRVATWIAACLNRLPHPKHLERLTIAIMDAQYWDAPIYPDLADYEGLYRAVKSVHAHGSLKRVDSSVIAHQGAVWTSKLGELFSPILGDLEEMSSAPNAICNREVQLA